MTEYKQDIKEGKLNKPKSVYICTLKFSEPDNEADQSFVNTADLKYHSAY
jgi:hypothetical protein